MASDNGSDKALIASARTEVLEALRLASDKLTRERFAGLAGLQYSTDRDVYKVAGYPDAYTFKEGWDRYLRQDIASRVVDVPVKKTWRHRPIILEGTGDEARDDTAFCDDWNELWDRLKLQSVFQRADRMAAIGKYSVLLLGYAGVESSDQAMALPQETGSLKEIDDVLFARPVKETDAVPQDWVKDFSARHGQPGSYQIAMGSTDGKGSGPKLKVHWTRVIHIVEDPLDSEVYGLPRLQKIINRLIDLEKIVASTAEAFWQEAVRILHAKLDPEATVKQGTLDDIEEDLEDLVHDLRRHWISAGVELDTIGGTTPDPEQAAKLVLQLIASASGIPVRILFGTETGERASQQDERGFLGTVAERQEQFAEPVMLRQYTDRLIDLGALGEPVGGYSFQWPALYELNELEISEIDENRANVAKALTPIGGDPGALTEITPEGRVALLPSAPVPDGEEDDDGPVVPEDGDTEE